MSPELFPAKVLLLGEYIVLHGGVALAVPFTRFTGSWQLNSRAPKLEVPFLDFLESLSDQLSRPFPIDQLTHLESVGWRFISDIPWGKGLGSSAALTASLYKTFYSQVALNIAHADLAKMESYFHGRSSGLDALVSYTSRPIYYEKNLGCQSLDLPRSEERVYLLDSEIDRATEPLVRWFNNRMAMDPFAKKIEELRLLSLECANSLRNGLSFLGVMKRISNLQFVVFRPLIPAPILKIWQSTLEDEKIAIKLCGAGGGGFFLVVSDPSVDVPTDARLAPFHIHALDNFAACQDESGGEIE